MAHWFDILKSPDGPPFARWIWPADGLRLRAETALFHGRLPIPPGAVLLERHASAEGRYVLFVNDQPAPLGRGPHRADTQNRALDLFDLDVAGGTGDVHLWVQVTHQPPPEAPLAEMHATVPGFVAFALFRDARGAVLATHGTGDAAWQALLCAGLTHRPVNLPAYHCFGQLETHHASGWPAQWRTTSVTHWPSPRVLARPTFKDDPATPTGAHSPHGVLVERPIPHLPETPVAPWRVHPEIDIHRPLAPGETLRARLDLGQLQLVYYRPTLEGPGTHVEITAGEVILTPAGKSFDVAAEGHLHPVTDRFVHDGPAPAQRFESAHWRAARFLDVAVTAGPNGGRLAQLELSATGYPLEREFEFSAAGADPALAATLHKITDVSFHTLRCCAWETYMDCPYYEQLQYLGDTRIQCLLTFVTTGDATLPAQALRAFDRSRVPEGLTQSRYPASTPQIIPPFSLIYILMIEDYLAYTGDDKLVAQLRPGIAPILNWFTPFINPDDGLIGPTPHWPFIDWVNGWPMGVPPQPSAAVNLFYLLALQAASRIYERSKAGSGNFYAGRAATLKTRIYDAFFDTGRGLLCDMPLRIGRGKIGPWSQHPQALAVLADLLSPTEARECLRTALDPKNLLRPEETVGDRAASAEGRFIAPASLYFRFYLAEALARVRMGELLGPLLEPFVAALQRGSTTWPESLEPSRSECHAWSAWPLYFFARHLLGIAPPTDDDRTRVRPLFCPPIARARGRFHGPSGPVDVAVEWTPEGKADVQAAGVRVDIVRGE